MKILCVFGQHNYGNSERGLSYEYVNFIPALRKLGYEVSLFDSWNKSLYKDFSDLNHQLLCKVQNEDPDIIFSVLMGYEIWMETFDLIRKGSNAALINWATDDSWKYDQFSHFVAPLFDVYATTYSSAMLKAKADGFDNLVLSQWAANSAAMAEPLPAAECRYDVSFIGTAYGNRKKWIQALKERGIEVTCFGYGWPAGPVNAEEIPYIMRASKLSLNLADSGLVLDGGRPVRSRQIKARVFEVPGAGGLLMTEPADQMEEYYCYGNEIVLFDSVDDLVEKIRHLLVHSDERDAIAKSGFYRTQKEHVYEERFGPLLEHVVSRRAEREGTGHGIELADFEKITKLHGVGLLMSVLKAVLMIPCMLIWGKQRGGRAARRFLFEVSWRLLGKRTYMASSLPGRMFYRES